MGYILPVNNYAAQAYIGPVDNYKAQENGTKITDKKDIMYIEGPFKTVLNTQYDEFDEDRRKRKRNRAYAFMRERKGMQGRERKVRPRAERLYANLTGKGTNFNAVI